MADIKSRNNANQFQNFLKINLVNGRKITTIVLSNKNIMKKYKVKEVIRMLQDDGWILMYTKEDH